MKILLLTQYYPPEGGSCSVHIGEMAEYLTSRGHDVTVVTGFPNYPEGKIYHGYRRRLMRSEMVNGVRVVRTFLFVTPERRSFGPRLKNYISFMVTAICGGLLSGPYELVYFYSPPLFLGLTAGLLGKLWGAPVVMELNDLWPRAPISLGVIKKPWQIRLALHLERLVYNWSTKIFAYSKRMRQEIIKAGAPKGKVEIHNLWIDTNFFLPASIEVGAAIRKEYGLNEQFIGMYTGLAGMAQGLDTLVNAAEILKMRGTKNIMIVIVGGGPERDNLIAEAEEKRLKNILFIDQQPRERMSAFMAASDLLISHLRKAPHRVGTIPAKILAYMCAAKPVLVGAEGEAADLVEHSQCGLAIPPDNPQAMAEAIMKMKNMGKKRLELYGKTAREVVEREYDQQQVQQKLEKRLLQIATQNLRY